MNDTIEVGMTYDEYLAQLRAEQFGWKTEEITSISDSDLTKPAAEPTAPVKKARSKAPAKKEVEELDEV